MTIVEKWKVEVAEGSQLLDTILDKYRTVIGTAYQSYRNHCQRVYHYALRLSDNLPVPNMEEAVVLCSKYAIAAAFHDIGLWTANTVDYIDPSEAEAKRYCEKHGKPEWESEICLMITRHHQLLQGALLTNSTVEIFRRADLVDFSWGWITWGVPRAYIRQLQSQIPNAGFHFYLVMRLIEWLPRNPLNPAPMFRLH